MHIKCSVIRYVSLNILVKSANDKKVYRSKVYRSEFTQLPLASPGMKDSVCACVGVRPCWQVKEFCLCTKNSW